MTPNDIFQDGDKTRIGRGINFTTSEIDTPVVGENFRHEQHQYISTPSVTKQNKFSEDHDMSLVVEGPATARGEFPLRNNEMLSVGRENNQDVAVDDRTLSRQHLLIQRYGDTINIQVLGLNGLVHNGITHKSTTVTLSAPSTFTIGRITCHIRKQSDMNATLLMNDPAQCSPTKGQTYTPPPHNSYAISSSASEAAPPSQFFASKNFQTPPPAEIPSAHSRGEAADSVQRELGLGPRSFTESSSSSNFEDFTGDNYWTEPFANDSEKKSFGRSLSGNNPPYLKYLVVAVCFFAILIFIYVFYFKPEKTVSNEQNNSITKEQDFQKAPENPPSSPVSNRGQSVPSVTSTAENYNLHGRYFNEAYKYYNEGEMALACDYLKDIPKDSAFYERATNLAKQIGNCKIND